MDFEGILVEVLHKRERAGDDKKHSPCPTRLLCFSCRRRLILRVAAGSSLDGSA